MSVDGKSDKSKEQELRRKLGIPAHARRVLIFSESSHWDPNWLHTSEEYFERFVRPNLDAAIQQLQREPRRIYSIECMFFLRMYWERCPAQRELVQSLINQGRLRLTSSGVTTADTLIPSAESILRDFLMGQEWLRRNGMSQEPRLAYFTDSFGCSAMLPSLLQAAGFDRTAITRIDGMFFPGCDLEPASRFPRPGSSAEMLLRQERSLDFIWRDANRAEVLCHWNAFTYGQGDLLAFRGLTRVYIFRLAIPDRSERAIARRIARYVAQLAPYSRTPYLFCPIGFDFVEPIPDLVALIDRHNQQRYAQSGIWVVNAALDDYLALVECHRDKLPILQLDPNPYWTGFYASRPTLKKRHHDLIDMLLLAERLSFHPRCALDPQGVARELQPAWWAAVTANHHDFITGTSTDRVVREEQIPWLEDACHTVRGLLDRMALAESQGSPAMPERNAPSFHHKAEGLEINTPHVSLLLSQAKGGAIVHALHTPSGNLILKGISNDIISFRDSGGLWRLGMEFKGGAWREDGRSSASEASLHTARLPQGLEISCQSTLRGERLQRRILLRQDDPLVYFRLEGKAPKGHTLTIRFESGIVGAQLVMDTPGGVVVRPAQKLYHPTFWPLHSFAYIADKQGTGGLAIMQRIPGAICYRPDGLIDLIALRNAPRERAYGFLPLPANPARGHEWETYCFDYALFFAPDGWGEIPALARALRTGPWDSPLPNGLHRLGTELVVTDNPAVWIAAVKQPAHAKGMIVRLATHATPENLIGVRLPYHEIKAAQLCDGRENPIRALPIHDGVVQVHMRGAFATLHIEIQRHGEQGDSDAACA